MGILKKITLSGTFQTDPLYVPRWFWRYSTTFIHSIEGGSSGSPLFNLSHKLIGTCSKTLEMNGGAFMFVDFSKFGSAWDGVISNPDSTVRLKDWLDPLNTDTMAINGRGNCQKTIRLRHRQPQTTDTYHAVQNIISEQTISNNYKITYKAGESIVLQAGESKHFHAQRGSTFHAQIEELICDNAPSLSFAHQGDESHNDIVNAPDFSLPLLKTSPKVNIVPNPNNGSFNIETNFPLSDIANLKITNLMGATVYETQNVVSNTVQLPRPTAGTFFVVMILKDGAVLTQKMVVR